MISLYDMSLYRYCVITLSASKGLTSSRRRQKIVYSEWIWNLFNTTLNGLRLCHCMVFYGMTTLLECPWASTCNSSNRFFRGANFPHLDERRKISPQSQRFQKGQIMQGSIPENRFRHVVIQLACWIIPLTHWRCWWSHASHEGRRSELTFHNGLAGYGFGAFCGRVEAKLHFAVSSQLRFR
jgi:hypothetical protein